MKLSIKQIRFVVALISTILLVVFGCDKSKDGDINKVEAKADSIVFTHFEPAIGICSVDKIYEEPYYYHLTWDPIEGNDTIYLDLNDDNIIDFYLIVRHNEYLEPPHVNYMNSYMAVKAAKSNAEVICEYNTARLFEEGESIYPGSKGDNSAYFFIDIYRDQIFDIKGEVYIGVRIREMEKNYIGWIKVSKDYSGFCNNSLGRKLWLHGHALNYTANRRIIAGQVE